MNAQIPPWNVHGRSDTFKRSSILNMFVSFRISNIYIYIYSIWVYTDIYMNEFLCTHKNNKNNNNTYNNNDKRNKWRQLK